MFISSLLIGEHTRLRGRVRPGTFARHATAGTPAADGAARRAAPGPAPRTGCAAAAAPGRRDGDRHHAQDACSATAHALIVGRNAGWLNRAGRSRATAPRLRP